MAAIPDAGGVRFAPRVVWRALLRVVLLSGLTVVAWLLGSGISHADEDLVLPGTGLIHVVNAPSSVIGASIVGSDDGSDDGLGTPAAVVPTVKKALSTAPVPRLPVQPPVQVSILRPIVQSVGITKPLDQVLPVSRPLSVPAQHPAPAQHPTAASPPAQTSKPATVPALAPTVAGKAAAPAPALTPVVHATPLVVYSPTRPAAKPVTIRPVLADGPASPIPANSPGSATSLCAISAAAGGTGSKNGPDVAVHDGWVSGGLAQPYDLLDRDTSGLPRSLSVQPSTSPD